MDLIPFIIIGIITFIVILLFEKERKYAIKNSFKQRQKEFVISHSNNKFVRFFSPTVFIADAQRCAWQLTLSKYFIYLSIGLTLSFFVLYLFFGTILILPMAYVGGILFIRTLLFLRNVKYKDSIEDKLSLFMKSIINIIEVYENVPSALNVVIELMEDPIQSDLKKVLRRLDQGKNIKESFNEFMEKYPYSSLRLFIHILHIRNETGARSTRMLELVQINFAKRKLYREDARTQADLPKKVYFILVGFFCLLPFIFMYALYDGYDYFIHHPVGKILSVYIVLSTLFGTYKILQRAYYDPTSEADR